MKRLLYDRTQAPPAAFHLAFSPRVAVAGAVVSSRKAGDTEPWRESS